MSLPPLKVKIGADTGGLEKGLDRAKRGLKAFSVAAGAAAAAVAGSLALMTRQGLANIDAQAKLARSVGGTVQGMQNLARAADLAGLSQGQLDATLQRMTRRISLAEQETGPAAEALDRLGLSASNLNNLDVDKRLDAIASRIREVIPAAEQAGVASQVFGEEIGTLIGRLDSETIRQATKDVTDFGVAVSEDVAAQVEKANDALTRIGLVFTGLQNQLAGRLAPTLEMISNRFAELASSTRVREGIDRLVEAFGALSEVILSEDFIGVAITGFEGLVNISASAAEGMVTLSQNVEIVTLAFSGLAIAVAAAGGPITLVAGALAAALGGIAVWRGKAEDAAEGSRTAAEAQEALNAALGVFNDTGAPNAGAAAIDLANENYKLAQSALAAASAEIARQKAEENRIRSMIDQGHLRDLTMEEEARISAKQAAAVRDRMEAERALNDAIRQRDRVARQVTGGGMTTPSTGDDSEGDSEGDSEITPFTIPELPGGGAVKDKLEGRLEALQAGLMTEREFVQEWYESGLEVLRDAREQELITEKEYKDQKERLEEEHQNRLARIREMGDQNALSSVVGTGQEILQALGSHNKKAMKAAQVLGAFEATVNAYRAASQALADPRLPWYAKVSAAGSLLAAGLGFASSIKSMSESGGGGGGRGGGSSEGGASAGSAPTPLNVNATFQGDFFTAGQVQTGVTDLLDQLVDEASRRGLNLTVTA